MIRSLTQMLLRGVAGLVSGMLLAHSAASLAAGAQPDPQTSAPTASTPAERSVIRQMSDLKIEATIKIGKTADWVAITADGVWVASTGPNAVSEIDPKTNMVTTVELPGHPCAGITADAENVWVPLCGPVPQLAKIDIKKRALDRVFPIGPAGPEGGIAVGAGSVWLVTDKNGTLARIDLMTGAVVQRVQVPAGSYNPVFSNGMVWVTHFDGAELTIVDPQSAKVVGQVAIGQHPRFTTAGAGAVWTLNQFDGSLSRVAVADRQTASTLQLHTPGPGGDIAFGDGRIWTTMMKTPLTAVDAKSAVVLCQWTGAGGDSLNIGHGAVWLTNLTAGTVSRIALRDIPAECSPKAAAN